MIRRIKKALSRKRAQPTPASAPSYPPDFDPAAIELVQYVEPFTMTSPERVFALRDAVRYVVDNQIPGDIVECGVWKGGSMMAVARTLIDKDDVHRDLYLYDTYEGMTEPTAADLDHQGGAALDQYRSAAARNEQWCFSPLEEVKSNLRSTGYDSERMHFVAGKVEETIPEIAPATIALLRLDTDWYESTHHEMVHLYPRLSPGGILIIDDYGHWSGARKAVDDYFREQGCHVLLNRVDYTARMCIKPLKASVQAA